MGINVKALLSHLCERQKDLGINAFKFHNVLWNNKLEPADYPEGTKAAMKGDLDQTVEGGHGVVETGEIWPTNVNPDRNDSPTKTPCGKVKKQCKSQLKTVAKTSNTGHLNSDTIETSKPITNISSTPQGSKYHNSQLTTPSTGTTYMEMSDSSQSNNRVPIPVPMLHVSDTANGTTSIPLLACTWCIRRKSSYSNASSATGLHDATNANG